MPRPPKPRYVEHLPPSDYFKPAGTPMSLLDEVSLGIDELETLRLKDLEGLGQDTAAQRMNLSQSTFQRILTVAREKVARALVEGRALRIEGGNYKVVPRAFDCSRCGFHWATPDPTIAPPQQCPQCSAGPFVPQWQRGRGHGGMGGRGRGPHGKGRGPGGRGPR